MLLPWLIVSMLELVLIAVPAAIFFALLGVYLYFKGVLVTSIIVTTVPGAYIIMSLVLWFIVLAAYNRREPKPDCMVSI